MVEYVGNDEQNMKGSRSARYRRGSIVRDTVLKTDMSCIVKYEHGFEASPPALSNPCIP